MDRRSQSIGKVLRGGIGISSIYELMGVMNVIVIAAIVAGMTLDTGG